MIKKIIKILSVIFLLIILLIIYLSFIGINTKKFNESITNRILKINKKIDLNLKDIKFLLNPLNFTAKITTKDPTIFLGNKELQIRNIKTNISLKSLFFNKFLLDEIKISTKPILLNDVILLARSFGNSTELFLLDKATKDGFLVADIILKFDDKGKIDSNYQINGSIKNGKFNFLNRLSVNNLNLNFSIDKKKYFLKKINAEVNDVQFSSPLIEVIEKKDLFFVKGNITTSKKNFNQNQLNRMFAKFPIISNIENSIFSTENKISFNINKKLKFNDLKIKTKINFDQLILKNNFINLKKYLPNFNELINFENHKVIINYDKDKLKIKGKGKVLIKNKFDFINYQIIKKNDKFLFDTKINLKNSKLLIDFLDYEKKENLEASIKIKGNFKNNNSINFDLVSFEEKNNKILLNNLNLRQDFKINNIDSFNFNYLNNKNIKNKLILKKINKIYTIEGESFDATKLIDKIMESKDENSTLFNNFNSKINLKINKTYINEVDFINTLSGVLNFKNNKIDDLDLRSTFPNGKMINLSIKTNNQKEKITKLFTDHPKPLIKRYDFIKGFEEGSLDYYSISKEGVSNSELIIDNFKVKEVPVFAKILSLASLQGIADLLTGEGIRFTDFEMKFSNSKGLTTIEEMYAIGPAVSILMDGYIESNKLLSLRGTLVPATTINRSIASIPLLGDILIGKKTGEGVFGVSFKIKGKSNNIKTTVNPIKTLTPRFITRTLEKIKKN